MPWLECESDNEASAGSEDATRHDNDRSDNRPFPIPSTARAYEGQVDALNIGGHDFARQVDGLQGGSELFTGAADDSGVDIFEPIANLDLVELPV